MIAEYFGLSAISIGVYIWIFKIKWWKVSFGVPAFIAAYYIEGWMLTPSDYLLLVVILAPAVEEMIKFVATIYGKDIKTGIGVGLGFALLENTLYFSAFSSMLLYIFIVRAFTDPILHSSTTSFSVKSWKGNVSWLLLAIGMHTLWNVVAVVASEYSNAIYLIFVLAGVYGSVTWIRLHKGKKQH